jgi:hypothetical protein
MQIMLRRAFLAIFIFVLICPYSVMAEAEKEANEAEVKKPSKAAVKEIGRDDRFVAYDNGTVLDTKTNLIWAAKDNGADIDWEGAKSYCEKYHAGGYADWRMPTQDEMEGLYDKSIVGNNNYHLTTLITLTASCFWSSETRRNAAFYFHFRTGARHLTHQSNSVSGRVLPVRSAK